MPRKTAEDITGKTFGDLSAIRLLPKDPAVFGRYWELQCSVCGDMTYRRIAELKMGHYNCAARCRTERAEASLLREVYENYRRNARKGGRVFELPIDLFRELITAPCSYCGVTETSCRNKPRSHAKTFYYNGLDRVDNEGGYTEDNVVTCCKFCNFAKTRGSLEEFQRWLMNVRGNAA